MVKVCFMLPQTYIYFNEEVKGQGGGAEKIAYILSTELAKHQNFDVRCYMADFGQPKIEERKKVKLYNGWSNVKTKVGGFIKLLKLTKEIDADVYVFAGSGVSAGIANLAVKLLSQKKTVYMLVHDSEMSFNESKKIIGYLGALVMSWAYKQNNAITAQSEYQKGLFTKNRKLKVDTILRNIIDLSNIEPAENKDRDKIIWVCRCERWKQPEQYLQLAKTFPNEQFEMVCSLSSDKAYWENIKKQAEEINNLEFFDYLPNSELAKHYKNVKIFVNTSTAEGFSFAMMEAMASGCAVATLNANPDSFLDRHNLGFCANGDVEIFHDKFQELATSSQMLFNMGQNARQYLEDYHSVKQVITIFKELIIEIAE